MKECNNDLFYFAIDFWSVKTRKINVLTQKSFTLVGLNGKVSCLCGSAEDAHQKRGVAKEKRRVNPHPERFRETSNREI